MNVKDKVAAVRDGAGGHAAEVRRRTACRERHIIAAECGGGWKGNREMNGLTLSVTVDRRARLFRFGALIAAAFVFSLSAFTTSARAAESDPTIVLVHGAFASPAGWDGVAAALHKDGYQTATPTLGLASVSDDVAIVRSTLDAIPGDKILVGHSYGGFVTTMPPAAGETSADWSTRRRTSQTAVRRSPT